MPWGLAEGAVITALHQREPASRVVADGADLLLSPGRSCDPRLHSNRIACTLSGASAEGGATAWVPASTASPGLPKSAMTAASWSMVARSWSACSTIAGAAVVAALCSACPARPPAGHMLPMSSTARLIASGLHEACLPSDWRQSSEHDHGCLGGGIGSSF